MGAIEAMGAKLGNQIQELRTSVKADMVDLKNEMTNLQTKCGENTGKIQELERSVEFAHGEINTVKEDAKELWAKIRGLEREAQTQFEEGRKVGEKVHDLERRSREYNFRVMGLKDSVRENCLDTVAELLKESLWAKGSKEEILENIEVAHRTGKPRPRVPRQMIVRCTTRRFRNAVVRAAKQNRRRDKIVLFEDLTQRDYQARQKAKPQMAEYYEQGFNVRFYRGKVIVGAKRVPANQEEVPEKQGQEDGGQARTDGAQSTESDESAEE